MIDHRRDSTCHDNINCHATTAKKTAKTYIEANRSSLILGVLKTADPFLEGSKGKPKGNKP